MLRSTVARRAYEALSEMGRVATRRSVHNFEATQEMVARLGLGREMGQLKFVHVAGTKGKGSTSTYASALLQQRGFKVGLFTSPHLVDVRERFRVNGDLVDEDRFASVFEAFKAEHDKAFDEQPWAFSDPPNKGAYFRFMFLFALRLFAVEKVDVVVLEVGLGGRIDSTNVVTPEVCGVTALGLDHCDVLGDTIQQIAREKAGIMKPGVPCFTVPQRDHPEALDVLVRHAADTPTSLKTITPTDYANGEWSAVATRGDHMVENAKLALALSRQFSGSAVMDPVSVDELAVLQRTSFSGRSQVLPPVGRMVPHLDGAHTPESIRVACRWFFDKAVPADTPATVVFYTSRDPDLLLAELSKWHHRIHRLVLVHYNDDTPVLGESDLAQVRAMSKAWNHVAAGLDAAPPCTVLERGLSSPADYQEVCACPGDAHPVLITGSLYLVGNALRHLQ